jgi:hypothetical protein
MGADYGALGHGPFPGIPIDQAVRKCNKKVRVHAKNKFQRQDDQGKQDGHPKRSKQFGWLIHIIGSP